MDHSFNKYYFNKIVRVGLLMHSAVCVDIIVYYGREHSLRNSTNRRTSVGVYAMVQINNLMRDRQSLPAIAKLNAHQEEHGEPLLISNISLAL